MNIHAFHPSKTDFTLCDVKIPGSNVVVASDPSKVLCVPCLQEAAKPPEPEPETTEFVLEYRVTQPQLEVVEWAMKNAKFRFDPPEPIDTPEKFMAYYLLSNFTRAIEDMRTMRGRHFVEQSFEKPREAPPPV